MKRSEINNAIEYVIEKLYDFKLPLPPFAYYTPDQWRNLETTEKELVDNMLGWDVTDFGTGDFMKVGLTVMVTFIIKKSTLNHIVKSYFMYVMDKFFHIISTGVKQKILLIVVVEI